MYIRKVVHKIKKFSKPSLAQSDVPVALLCDSATVCQPLVLSSRSIMAQLSLIQAKNGCPISRVLAL